jgi:hypothetical protein
VAQTAGGPAPELKRRRLVAAVLYVVVLVTLCVMIAWRFISP